MKVIFQEWMDHASKKIIWSLSTDTESLNKVSEVIEAGGTVKLGDAMECTVPDDWDRLEELKEQRTIFLQHRHDLLQLF